MAIELNETDHKGLDNFLSQVLDWHASGEIDKLSAVGVIAHVFTAAAIDNEGEVKGWLNKPEVLLNWKRDGE
ncbi:hypothetical protein [Roseospira navarrensis]|uniref:Uncharacterized protein n=1 Tax=Roseospira navarrensis TaxID=140058 RepID=A0A7X1ZHT9_9PROT|nr:hypothetical protein [Roseospira navarrensis]MQX37891.1 hypothetical protein [Roseospira navarrensis]